MSTFTGILWRILRENNPVAIVYYPESATREALIEEAELLAPPERKVLHARDIDAAFHDPEAIVLLTPGDEVGAVDVLDQRREALCDRTAPAVLFLLCGGTGEQRLREAYALASWVRGREYDPWNPESMDVAAARSAFEHLTGRPLKAWLNAWLAGELADTLENDMLAHEAAFLDEGT